MSEFDRLKQKASAFAKARDWDQFHSPKNLTMALGGEIAELLDLFQWKTEAQSWALTQEEKIAVAHEIADIQIYLLRLADKLEVDIPGAVDEKMAINERKYPADKARGSARKYTAYQNDEGEPS